MYKVLHNFSDKTDNNRLYLQGAEYPQGEIKPTKARIKTLADAGFIQKAEEPGTEEENTEETAQE